MMILPRFKCLIFFATMAASIGVVSVLALPVLDPDAALISTSESPLAIDGHDQASPQSKCGLHNPFLFVSSLLPSISSDMLHLFSTVDRKEITITKRDFENKNPVYLARSSQPIKVDAHFTANFKPMAFQVIPFELYKDDQQWEAAAERWSELCSNYVLNPNRELYRLVRKSQVSERPSDLKMKLIEDSEFYKRHHERLGRTVAAIFDDAVKPQASTEELMLFNAYFILTTANELMESQINWLTGPYSGICFRFRLFHEKLIARIKAGKLDSRDMVRLQLADAEYNGYKAYYLSGAYEAVPVVASTGLKDEIKLYIKDLP
ncbi:hypothetical protein C8R42DRAFT_310635 [Lentinula raphanica]|nr:hypothetical protein C8R42DRAFT_310635 [Lentinula raphanica]